jgi:PAS domain S-box-containing protein
MGEGVPFAIQALDKIHHGTYSRWVKAGVAAAAGAYALVTLLDVLIQGFSPVTVLAQGATVGLCMLALWLAFRNRLEIAGTLTIGAIWLELHSGLLSSGLAISSIVVMPTLIVGAGLLWGGRGAYALAGATSISVTGLALIGHRVLGTPAGDLGDEVYLAVVLIVVMFVSAVLIDLSMRALGSVVVSSLASERRVAELVRHLPDGIMALEKDLSIISANPEAERLLGSSEGDLIGTSAVTVLSARLSLQAMSDLSPSLLQSGEPIAHEFSAGQRKVTVDVTTTSFQCRDGSEGIQLTLHDATGRVRAQEQKRAIQARLEETNRLNSVRRLAGGAHTTSTTT